MRTQTQRYIYTCLYILLGRSMTEKYSSKSIDDKRLISTKFNLIY
jgi:hypothetical protein